MLLEVRGKLVWLSGASKGVGDPTSGQITSAKIAGGCASSVTGTAHTCSSASPANDYFYVKDGGYSTLAPAIVAPTLSRPLGRVLPELDDQQALALCIRGAAGNILRQRHGP